MLLARGLDGFGAGRPVGGLKATPLWTQAGLGPTVTVGTAQTTAEFKPPATGYSRGDIWFQEDQYKLRNYRQRDRVIADLKAQYNTGQLQPCSTVAVARADGTVKQMGFSELQRTCRFYDRNVFVEDRYAQIHGQAITDPIGVIYSYVTLGVPFMPMDLKTGNPTHPGEPTIEATYMPTNDQRWLADRAIYYKSMINLAKLAWNLDLSSRTNLHQIFVDPNHSTGFIGLFHQGGFPGNLSLQDFRDHIGNFDGTRASGTKELRFTWSLPGYGMNPLTPTQDEIFKPLGAQKYFDRGGFLIDKHAARGLSEVAKGGLGFTMTLCMSDKCATSDAGSSLPTPVRYRFTGEGEGWLTFIKINPDGMYTIRIQAKEESTAKKVLREIAQFIAALPKWICQAAPAITAYNQTLIQETCTYPDGTSCKKGETKTITKDGKTSLATCNCQMPTDGQQLAVGGANLAITKICGLIAPPPTPAPPMVVPMPEAAFPWPWVIGGGLVLAAVVAFSKR